jgi:hypothetical protein
MQKRFLRLERLIWLSQERILAISHKALLPACSTRRAHPRRPCCGAHGKVFG